MADIEIRKASKNDIPIVLGLLYEFGRPKPENTQVYSSENIIAKTFIILLDQFVTW